MNVDKVEILLGKLASKSDKKTIKYVIELLEELYEHTPKKKVNEELEEEINETASQRASRILDGFVPKDPLKNVYTQQQVSNDMLPTNIDITSHAGDLL